MENNTQNLTAGLPTWVILFIDGRHCCEVTAEKNGLIGFRLVFVHVHTPFSTKPGRGSILCSKTYTERSHWSNQLDSGGQVCLVRVRYFLKLLLIQSFLLRNSSLFTVKSALVFFAHSLPWPAVSLTTGGSSSSSCQQVLSGSFKWRSNFLLWCKDAVTQNHDSKLNCFFK